MEWQKRYIVITTLSSFFFFLDLSKKTMVALGGNCVGPGVIDTACPILEGTGFALEILNC